MNNAYKWITWMIRYQNSYYKLIKRSPIKVDKKWTIYKVILLINNLLNKKQLKQLNNSLI